MPKKSQDKKKVLTIDPKKVKEGTCHILELNKQKFSVCKEKGKLKIFPAFETEEKSE